MFHDISIYKMSIPFRDFSVVLWWILLIDFVCGLIILLFEFLCLLFNRQQTRNVYSSSKPVNIKYKNRLCFDFIVFCYLFT